MNKRMLLAATTTWFFISNTLPATAGLPGPYGERQIAHRVIIPKLQAPLEIHTHLDRSPWTEASRLTGNLNWRRIRSADARAWTYLFYDDQALWVAFRNEQVPGPDLKREVNQQDGSLRKDDNFEFWLDVGRTGRTYYKFFTNANGILYDAFIVDKSYNSSTTVKTVTDEQGWTAVLRIPFTDLPGPTPTSGTTWAFNSATRTGHDHSWAPVLGGYHIPEQFALLVFGGEHIKPVRLETLGPLTIGENRITIDAPAGTGYRLEAIDRNDRTLMRNEGMLDNGQLSFALTTDTIQHINFAFVDAKGKELLTFWRPFDSPSLLNQLPELRTEKQSILSRVNEMPLAGRDKVQTILRDIDRFTEQVVQATAQDWTRLAQEVVHLRQRARAASLWLETIHQLSGNAGSAIAFSTPMDKVMIKDFPCQGSVAKAYDLALARNEHEGMQVVIIPYLEDLKGVSVTVSPPLSTKDGSPFAGKVSVGLVGHVKTREAGSYLPEYVGWYPDPILDFQQQCDAATDEQVAFWIDVATAENTKAGHYRSTITMTARDHDPIEAQLNIRVWDFALQDGTHLGNAFTYSEPATKKLYRGRWSEELAYRYYDFILDHRLNIDGLYGKHVRGIDMLKHGVSRGMRSFNLFYVGKGAGAETIGTLVEERMQSLKEAGLDDLAYIYGFDEVNDDIFPKIREIFGLVHTLYPNLKRMTTGYDTTFGKDTDLRDYIDIWVPLVPRYNMTAARQLRAEGKDMWWYICVGPRPPFPNFFVESPAIEARLLMGAMSYKYQAGGVLYFMTNLWKLNDHPITSGPYTDWFPGIGKSREGVYANGDGSLFCAGPDGPVTTIRYENIRDGLEDYEYLHTLATVAESVRRQTPTIERLAFLERAGELLTVPDHVVESSARFTGNPRMLYDLRTAIAEAIIEGIHLNGTVTPERQP